MQKLTYFSDTNAVKFIETPTDYVDSIVLVANTNAQIAIPAGARFCRLSYGAQFYYSMNVAASIATASNTGGTGSVTASIYERPFLFVSGAANINVISATAGVLSAEFWA